MHRFYVPAGVPADGPLELPRDVARQISRVLRMRTGEEIGVFDGTGVQWTIELDDVSARSATGHVVDVTRPGTESRVEITLYQSIIDTAAFELVLQKGAELGVTRFVPLLTERVRGAGSVGASDSRQRRWARIVQEASEQSGRVFVPEVTAPIDLDVAFEEPSDACLIVPWEGELSVSLRDVLSAPVTRAAGAFRVLIGPKGGLTESEIDLLRGRGAWIVTLGTRILRAETAAIATLSAILYELDELGTARS
ncbi:MAG: RsmE family RNA methyltransferase [Chloroflexi bacterium]|nr:RsmE family RNA methyltransferase [Chloroflexota bacterium]